MYFGLYDFSKIPAARRGPQTKNTDQNHRTPRLESKVVFRPKPLGKESRSSLQTPETTLGVIFLATMEPLLKRTLLSMAFMGSSMDLILIYTHSNSDEVDSDDDEFL